MIPTTAIEPTAGDFTALKAAANTGISFRTQSTNLPFSLDWIVHFNSRLAKLSPGSPLVFMISGKQPQFAIAFKDIATKVPLIMHDQIERAGIIIVGNAPGSKGCYIPANGRNIAELITWAEENGADFEFTLAAEAGRNGTLVFPEGLAHDDKSYQIDHVILDKLLTAKDISSGLNNFCTKILNAADIKSDIWKNRSGWIPVTLAEKRIQDLLMIFFRGLFISPSTIVLQEITNPDGRCDVSIKSKHFQAATNSSLTREFILELKALKSFTEKNEGIASQTHEAAIDKGLQQAQDYKETFQAEVVFLCVFDLRKAATSDLKDRMLKDCSVKEIVSWWEMILPNTAERRKVAMTIAS